MSSFKFLSEIFLTDCHFKYDVRKTALEKDVETKFETKSADIVWNYALFSFLSFLRSENTSDLRQFFPIHNLSNKN